MRKSVEKRASKAIDIVDAAWTAPRAAPASDASPAIEPTTLGDLHIREMSMEDVAEVAEMEVEVFPDPWSVDSFLAELDRRPDVGAPLVARDRDGRLVAYAVVWFIVDEVHIGNIAVRPDRQGQGIGSRLLRYVMEEGQRRGFAFATLEVRPSNAPALRLYERFGFHRIAVRSRYYRDGEDAYVLAAPIDAAEQPRG
jgi:ribosomal-protein-alanine N-acetyltransferase